MAIFRFSNAVSDAKKIISTYKTIYNELSKAESFGHDDARDALVKNSLVSSSGAIGDEAIRRSVRDDRSRDPLYNQAKMYGEMFRMLGWYKPAQNRLNFRFTEIASYIADADEKTEKKIFEFNVYSITSPSPLVEIKGGNVLRPLPLILKLATLLDGYISRDEIILAVLTCLNDKTPDALDVAKEIILEARTNGDIKSKLIILGKKEDTQITTLENYTRFPLGALKYCGWAEPKSIKTNYSSRKINVYMLTPHGIQFVNKFKDKYDLRYEEIIEFDLKTKAAFSYVMFLRNLEFLDYEIDEETLQLITILEKKCALIFNKLKVNNSNEIFYSSIQQTPNEVFDYIEKLEIND
jgi:hypothetical protein